MRFGSSFFASLPNFGLDVHRCVFKIHIPNKWNWFFLNQNQLFLFFQDPVHLVTKWRNRLLSSTTNLCFGNDKITIMHIKELLDDDSLTRLDHGLTKADVNPKDRQNYKSCINLISDDVINLLSDRINTDGTVVYLQILKLIVTAYIDPSTNVRERK